MKRNHSISLAAAIAATTVSVACSSDFHSCYDRRSCPPGGKEEILDAGAAGEANPSGGSGGLPFNDDGGAAGKAILEAGAAGEAGEAGEAGGAGACEGLDLSNDSKNCGACGHDCMGGECEQAQCQPTTLVPAEGYISAFVVVGDHLYWSGCDDSFSDFFVARSRLDGSEAVKTLTKEGATTIAASGNQLLWVGQERVRACDLPDCNGGPRDLIAAPKLDSANVHFAAATATLFWAGKQSGLFAFTLGTSTSTPVGYAHPDFFAIASDARNVYWGNGPSLPGASDGAIYKARLADLSPVALASGLTQAVAGLAVGADALYVDAGKSIFKIPLPNGIGTSEPQTHVVTQTGGGMIIVGPYLYWANATLGSIQRCPLVGCELPEVVITTPRPGNLTQDTKSLLWTEFNSLSGRLSILRLAK